jgi:hypothetical protein
MAEVARGQPVPRRRRASKRAIRVWAAAAGAVSFALPWAAIHAMPRPAATAPVPQVVYVPLGSRVVVVGPGSKNPGVRVIVAGGGANGTTATSARTPAAGGSHPLP